MRPIRIAVLVGETFGGGVGSCLLNYFRHLDATRFALDFFVHEPPSDGLAAELEKRGAQVVPIPSRGNPVVYVFRLVGLFRRGRYDIVHANLTTLNVFPLLAARLAGVPVRIAHGHSMSNPADRKAHLAKQILRPFSRLCATHLFACAEGAGIWLFGKKAMTQGKVTVVRNAIEPSRFAFDDEKGRVVRERFGLTGKFVVGHVGRLTPAKNHRFLIEVFRAVYARCSDARLLLVGDGELKDEIRAQIARLGLSAAVVFAGNQAEVAPFYSAMDVFVFPSLFEGLGMVLVEAQVNGLACLASDCVPEEANVLGRVTFLALSDSPETWASHVMAAQRGDAGSSSVRLAESGYDITQAVRELEAAYERAAAGNMAV